ncbi:MAG: flagellar basal body-associated protein FliL [Usitatibacteraceae bacterium]
MSDAAAAKGPAPSEAAPGKSRKMLFAGAAVAILALGGGGAYYFLKPKPVADDGKGADAHAAAPAAAKHVVYLPMDTFTVNLRDPEQERYLQSTINLELADTATADALKLQMPSVRNRVLLLLSSKTSQELMTREGKELLSAEIAAELRKTLGGNSPTKGVEQVLFSHFVIQ